MAIERREYLRVLYRQPIVLYTGSKEIPAMIEDISFNGMKVNVTGITVEKLTGCLFDAEQNVYAQFTLKKLYENENCTCFKILRCNPDWEDLYSVLVAKDSVTKLKPLHN